MNADYDACFGESEAIADPIYGMVEISSFEKRLLACREMQRLRHIRQLGLVHMVYPAAEHSRFTHSIGVCYQAKALIDQVNANMTREARYREWRAEGTSGKQREQPIGFHPILPVEKVVISAAALLHDLPHAPFSHDIESPSVINEGIPAHDEFATNPALFTYLFDGQHSQVAQVIKAFNSVYWKEGVQSPNRGGKWGAAILERWSKVITEEGLVRIGKDSPVMSASGNPGLKELPILGLMIFEIHLCEKEEHWLLREHDKRTKKTTSVKDIPNAAHENAQEVTTDWDNKKKLRWIPLYGWFRPYRKEIIGNTICADLIDYIQRDGHHTGVISHLDLKFLDRMAITKAIVGDGHGVDTWGQIPETCEHVVFDIYDHKRGFVRLSVITEILACLQARYLLCERVYQHRVVEGARAMLQHLSQLLCEVQVLSLKALHLTSGREEMGAVGDDAFLAWIAGLDDSKYEESKRSHIRAAKELASMILERRVYREAIIIDGMHGTVPPGTLAGQEKNCEALADALIPHSTAIAEVNSQFFDDLSEKLKDAWDKVGRERHPFPMTPALVGIREFGKRHKVPVVLVAKPYRWPEKEAPLEIRPLFICSDPRHIRDQLEAMKSAYDSLWKVYLFLHPGFHKSGSPEQTAHRLVERLFVNHLRGTTKLEWRNSIEFGQLLPKESIDIQCFLYDETMPCLLLAAEPRVRSLIHFAAVTMFGEKDGVNIFVDGCYSQLRDKIIRDERHILLGLADDDVSADIAKQFQELWVPPIKEAARSHLSSDKIQLQTVNSIVKLLKQVSDRQQHLAL